MKWTKIILWYDETGLNFTTALCVCVCSLHFIILRNRFRTTLNLTIFLVDKTAGKLFSHFSWIRSNHFHEQPNNNIIYSGIICQGELRQQTKNISMFLCENFNYFFLTRRHQHFVFCTYVQYRIYDILCSSGRRSTSYCWCRSTSCCS